MCIDLGVYLFPYMSIRIFLKLIIEYILFSIIFSSSLLSFPNRNQSKPSELIFGNVLYGISLIKTGKRMGCYDGAVSSIIVFWFSVLRIFVEYLLFDLCFDLYVFPISIVLQQCSLDVSRCPCYIDNEVYVCINLVVLMGKLVLELVLGWACWIISWFT